MKRSITLLTAGLVAALAGCEDREADKEATAPEIQPANPEQATPERAAAPDQPAAGEAAAPDQKMAAREKLEDAAEEAQEITQLLKNATATLREMKSNEKLKGMLDKSKGVFIVPQYGRGAVGVGARGGEGVLVARDNGKWSDPLFYDIGGISIGAQLGAEGGEVAMLLMSQKAVDAFKDDNAFSLNADAKLTLVDYSALAEATSLGEGKDVVFWSDTEGAFAGVALSATDIAWDDEENPVYYGKKVTAADVLSGKVTGPSKSELQQELSKLQ